MQRTGWIAAWSPRLRASAVNLALLLFAATLSAQSLVTGRITNSVTGQPVRKATVLLRGNNDTYVGETGSDGSFRIEGVPGGSYDPSAHRSGFYTKARLQTLNVLPGQPYTLSLVLTPLGVITGHVLTPDGDPISHIRVQAMQYRYDSGRKRLAGVGNATTDDHGEYRLFDLMPGRYYVQAQSDVRPPALREGADPLVFGTAYYPGSSRVAEAKLVDAAAGAETRGIDVHVHPETLFTLRAKFGNGPDFSSPARLLAAKGPIPFPRLQRRDGDLPTFNSLFLGMRNGAYQAPNLAPGSYVVVCEIADTEHPGRKLYARQVVEIVDRDPEIATLNFLSGVDVAGTLEGPGAGVRVRLEPEDFGGSLSIPIHADGSFALQDVKPDLYSVRVTLPEGVYLKSMRIGGRETPSQALDLSGGVAPSVSIAVGHDGGRIEGTVRDLKGEIGAGARVALIPGDGWPDRARVTLADADGAYVFADVAPGDYQAFAWEQAEAGAALDAEFRKPYAAWAIPVKVAAESRTTVPLTAR